MDKRIWRLLPHAAIILSLFVGTLWVLDQLNPLMDFMDNPWADAAIFLFCILALINGIRQVWQSCHTEEV